MALQRKREWKTVGVTGPYSSGVPLVRITKKVHLNAFPWGPGKLSSDLCPLQSQVLHSGLRFHFISRPHLMWGLKLCLSWRVSQLLYPNSCWHRFQSPGIILGTGESFADQVCGFLGHIISSETQEASDLIVPNLFHVWVIVAKDLVLVQVLSIKLLTLTFLCNYSFLFHLRGGYLIASDNNPPELTHSSELFPIVLLRTLSRSFLKPLPGWSPICGQAALAFYQSMQDTNPVIFSFLGELQITGHLAIHSPQAKNVSFYFSLQELVLAQVYLPPLRLC